MEDKKIKELIGYSEENRKEILEIRIKEIQKHLNDLKKYLAKLNNYRDRWTDYDVAVLCWLLAHDPDELKFWKEIEL
ncbi:MAG TPA: hypothetical protein VKL21_09150 [Candidatus Methanoperedens sp.]|nr:hypothetical protein [Candidatus Methanoperedens sp.]